VFVGAVCRALVVYAMSWSVYYDRRSRFDREDQSDVPSREGVEHQRHLQLNQPFDPELKLRLKLGGRILPVETGSEETCWGQYELV
jgi:hypothetical protein